MELPLALAHGFESVAVEIGEGFPCRSLLALEQRKEGLAVDLMLRLGRGAGLDERRHDVDVRGERIRAAAGLHDARPTDDERHADAALEGRTFAFTERSGRTRMTTEVQPRAVVAGEDHDGLLLDAGVGQGLEHGAHRAIDIGEGVGIGRGALALEVGRGPEGRVRHGGRQIEEERLVLAGTVMDEADGAQALGRSQRVHVRPIADEAHRMAVHVARQFRIHLPTRFVADGVAQRPHVVRIRQDHRIVETVVGREEFRGVAKVPLAHDPGVITGVAQQSTEGLLVVAQAGLRLRAERDAAQAETVRVTAGHQRRTRRGTYRLRRVEASEAQPFLGQAIDVRRHVLRRTVATRIGPPHVVAHDINDVRPGAEQGRAQQEAQGWGKPHESITRGFTLGDQALKTDDLDL